MDSQLKSENVCGFIILFQLNAYLIVNWSTKAIRRTTTGTGRVSHIRNVQARYPVLRREAAKYTQRVAQIQAKAIRTHKW
jgi:hypothetical protein